MALVLCRQVSARDRGLLFWTDRQHQNGANDACSLPLPLLAVPFLVVHNVPIVQLELNRNKRELFILDSGSERTTLNSDEAARLHLRLSSPGFSFVILGMGDSQSAMAAHSIKIGAGKVLILKGDVPAVSLAPVATVAGMRITGILGYDVLRAHPTVIDYANRQFLIYDKGHAPKLGEECGVALAVDKNGATPIVDLPARIGDQYFASMQILIDTGSQVAMLVNRSCADARSLEKMSGWKPGIRVGIGGDAATLHGLPGGIEIGNQRLDIPDVELNLAPRGYSTWGASDAQIGGPLFAGRMLLFDSANGTLYFSKAEEGPAK